MLRFTASYARTNPNFVIQNVTGTAVADAYTPAICVLKNLLQRGTYTRTSEFLQQRLGMVLHRQPDFNDATFLIDQARPHWHFALRDADQARAGAARLLFEEQLPRLLPDYAFLPQLLWPDARVGDLLPDARRNPFADQRVSFYLPTAFLVIDLDEETPDAEAPARDAFLRENGLAVVRLNADDILTGRGELGPKMAEIASLLRRYESRLGHYRQAAATPFADLPERSVSHKLRPAALMRFQLLLLELLHRGRLHLTDERWTLNVRSHDVADFAELATEDLLTWFGMLLRLMAPHRRGSTLISRYNALHRPTVEIRAVKPGEDFPADGINVDFSVLKRWTDEAALHPDVLYVRTDYVDEFKRRRVDPATGRSVFELVKVSHFRVSTSAPFAYDIVHEGPMANVTALRGLFRSVFGFQEFLPGQLSVMANALARRETIGLLPTGGGKSVCYQMAALLQPAVSFVICPSKALMRDQVDDLRQFRIDHVASITGDMDAPERDRLQQGFVEGRYFFVLISPERCQTQHFRNDLLALSSKLPVAYAVIDEAHCLSEWGHDFRLSYLNLIRTIRRYCAGANLVALSATVSINVLKDLQADMGVGDEDVKMLADYSRPELTYTVIDDRGAKLNWLTSHLRAYRQLGLLGHSANGLNAGLVFTPNVNGERGCYPVAQHLQNVLQPDVRWYAGTVPHQLDTFGSGQRLPVMSPAEFEAYRIRVQDDYKLDKFTLLVATKAFGMGINKENIRFTAHYGVPASMEALYQEAGRAGRDRQRADCAVLLTREPQPGLLARLLDQYTWLEEIEQMLHDVPKSEQGDVMTQLFLLVSSQQGIRQEADALFETANALRSALGRRVTLVPGRYPLLPGMTSPERKKQATERAVYRLHQLGLVHDWTVDWGPQHAITVELNPDWRPEQAEEHLLDVVRRYNPDFRLADLPARFAPLFPGVGGFERSVYGLLVWTYTEITYSRKQSLKTVYDYCCQCAEGKISPEEFRQRLEAYFRIDTFSYLLQDVFDQSLADLTPDVVDRWFSIFYRHRHGATWLVPKNADELEQSRPASPAEVQAMNAQIRRFLESKNNNVGLNLQSGLLRALAGDYADAEGRGRFEAALAATRDYLPQPVQRQVANRCLSIIANVPKDTDRQQMSQTVLAAFPETTTPLPVLAEELRLPSLMNDWLLERLETVRALNRRLYEQVE